MYQSSKANVSEHLAHIFEEGELVKEAVIRKFRTTASDDKGLFKDYTMQSLLDELDTIEYYQQPGKAHHLSEITEKQRKLYELLDVSVPS